MDVHVYDTTLRDGSQGEGLQLTVADKLAITELLDELGVGYVEGGWPGSNPRDESYFEQASKLSLKHARLCAFGSTRRAKLRCEGDPSIQALLAANVPCITVFGKAWKFHASQALGISPDENLELIADTIRFLKARVDEVIFDAEHFFDGFIDDEAYSLRVLQAAHDEGADWLVLCDTNGGSMPALVERAARGACAIAPRSRVGIHTHNDAELAVANSLAAVLGGATMVQGTINGYGERCGNANLVSVIANLELKLGKRCLPAGKLASLTRMAHAVDEIANRTPQPSQPYVGQSAFAHKGGVHVDAVRKDNRTYEHVNPELVGNRRRILISDLSGKANVQLKAEELGIDLDVTSPQTRAIVQRVKDLESQGYQYEDAEASFHLIVQEALGKRQKFFDLTDVDVHVHLAGVRWWEQPSTEHDGRATVSLKLEIGDVRAETTAEGNGPVHALDAGVRKLLEKFYPSLRSVKLLDYKVRVLSGRDGTGSVVRVHVQSGDGQSQWGTVGVSPNVIEASAQAIVDAMEYKLTMDGELPRA